MYWSRQTQHGLAGIWLVSVFVGVGCARTGDGTAPAADTGVVLWGPDAGLDTTPDLPPTLDISLELDGVDIPELPDEDVPDDVPVLPICGNGILEAGETCDDGPLNSNTVPDACRLDCVAASCGDGVVDSDEPCDPGDEKNDFGPCDNDCRVPATPCLPCTNDAACGRGVDRCVPLLDGRFCLLGCLTTEQCPLGQFCDSPDGRRGGVCRPPEEVCGPCLDNDGDGYGIGLECLGPDCDDTNPNINPGAEEICDDIDNNCNALNDEVCPPDLIVDPGEVVTLHGPQLFDRVEVRNGGVLRVTPFSGSANDGTGCLRIDARRLIVGPSGAIDATAAGGGGAGTGTDGGFGPGLANTGPAGGGYGGVGGGGPGMVGGVTYGTATGPDLAMGSNGGAFRITAGGLGPACNALVGRVTAGGIGGGCISFRAYQPIEIDGRIVADGTPGEDATDGSALTVVDGGGGGSGGGILLEAPRITLAVGSVLRAVGARGGRGGRYGPAGVAGEECIGNGGGGGGGGRIKLIGDVRGPGTVSVGAGAGANGPQSNARNGEVGTVFRP